MSSNGRVFAATGDYRLLEIVPDGATTTIASLSGKEAVRTALVPAPESVK